MKKIFLIASTLCLLNSCTSDFAETNTNPLDIVNTTPEALLPMAIKKGYDASFEYYYDYYRRIMPWTQTLVPSLGNPSEFMDDGSNMNARKDVFYGDHGSLLTDIIHKIDQMPAEEQAKYVNIKSIATILKVYYAWYVTDVNGSMAYTEAFQARYGGTVTPKFETQEQLYDIFDSQLNSVYTAIEGANQSIQVKPGAGDLFFNGDILKWKKVSNSLRLKIASRLMKRNPAKLTAIATQVLSRDQITSTAEDFSLRSRRFTEHGNFNPAGFSATKPMVDFMGANNDPRLPLFFQKNSYTKTAIKRLSTAGLMNDVQIIDSTKRYVGGPVSPDMSTSRYYTKARRSLNGITYDTVSRLQYRIWQPEYNAGTGNAVFPILTYADYSLLKAELQTRGLISTGSSVQSLYEQGIIASIATYNFIAKEAVAFDYTPTMDSEITGPNGYLLAPDVKFNPSKALEQIIIQEYLNYFKQPNEVWALIKRTDMPNTSTALKLETPTRNGGIPLTMPRRIVLPTPSMDNLNYSNQQAALNLMKQDPDFGTSENDIQGRIWWDKK
ncbi:SusD/RagB family nutrient-binding outer membrane lipoprotein [Chryseobacterium daeguense]|uniref:SusD/RagB family nutrient-binding outer membrane lipoprotein n=1 Tax=Chryseobacterium daeguense TaxID=412438 RepID=UPI00041085FA|nr:SusD/RagB family nutrient-binding outer membrane lipoprotein [Chryseobacterium daeguense]